MGNNFDWLPSGWAMTCLEHIVSGSGVFGDGDWIESKDQDADGEVRLVQLADIGEMRFLDKSRRRLTYATAEKLNCTFLRRGDLLISRLGDPLGKTCIYPANEANAVTAVDVCILRPNNADIDPKLFGYFLNSGSVRSVIESHSSGTTRKRVTGKKLKGLQIHVPPSNEQRRITEKIDTLFARLDKGEAALRDVQKGLARYRQSVLKAAVTGELTRDWRAENAGQLEHGRDLLARILETRRDNWQGRGKYKEPVAPDTTDLPELPESWTWVSLGSLILNGPQNGLYLPKSKYGAGIPMLRIDDYQIDWMRSRDCLQLVQADAPESKKYALAGGDFVINRVNSVSHLGKTALIGDEYADTLFESNMMRFAVSDALSKEYVGLYLTSALGRKLLIKNCKHAVNQASINQSDVAVTPIPLPPLIEQKAVAERVLAEKSRMDVTAHSCQTELTRSKALRQSILKQAFAGRLVPQDPTDEPASELLARIRAERTAEKPVRRRKALQRA